MNVAIIGGGAAGFFLAVNLKQMAPQARITIFEKSRKVLAKVAVSGGGRCNLTNSFREVTDLKQVYPRGDKLLKRLFKVFSPQMAYEWFEAHGVRLVTQEDQCVFPQSQDAQSVIFCLTRLARERHVEVLTGRGVDALRPEKNTTGSNEPEAGTIGYRLVFQDGSCSESCYDYVAVTTGGSPRAEGLRYLADLGHQIAFPVPSLFTFNVSQCGITALMGTVVEQVQASIPATNFKAVGPLLVTHWGMSGPAVLKLSSHGARYIAEHDYRFTVLLNWVDRTNTEAVAEEIRKSMRENGQKQLASVRLYHLPARLWSFLLERSGIAVDKRWAELSKKEINRLVNTLCSDAYAVDGKGAFRDEFVTCGGISLDSVDKQTLESKVCPGLFFAGEVLDIDGVTGGFNFQAAWTTAFVCAKSIVKKMAGQ